MRYLSVCSGIEAATVAWHGHGFQPLAFSEIDKFPRQVLAHHYPDVPLHGDFTVLREQDWIGDADVLVGGTPCQAFSVAGLRNSLDDDRGNLTLEFVRLADAIDDLRPTGYGTIIVWENVPGVLSVKDNAFGCFLGALVGNDDPIVPTGGKWTNAGMVVGPKRSAAWRVLDAQYFGVAQRRRRVFVVASSRDGFDPAEVLFEREGVRRDTPPSREKGQGTTHATAPCPTGSGRGVDRTGDTRGQDPVVAVAGSLDTQCGGGKLTHQSVANGHLVAARMVAFGEYVDDGTASTMKSRDWKDATDLVAQPALTTNSRVAGTLAANTGGLTRPAGNANGLDFCVVQPVAFGVGENFDLGHCLRSGASKADKHESTTYVAQPTMIHGTQDPCLSDIAFAQGRNSGQENVLVQAMAIHPHVIGRSATAGPQGKEYLLDGSAYTMDSRGVAQSVAYPIMPIPFDTTQITSPYNYSNPKSGDPCHPLAAGAHIPAVATSMAGGPSGRNSGQENVSVQPIAFSAKDHGADAGIDLSPTLRAMPHDSSHANGGGQLAVAQPMATHEIAGTMVANNGGGGWSNSIDHAANGYMAIQQMAVRRLTPRECERLQGFPDDYTNIPKAADGPRYKALGNSMAVPVMAWIGKRIANHLQRGRDDVEKFLREIGA